MQNLVSNTYGMSLSSGVSTQASASYKYAQLVFSDYIW